MKYISRIFIAFSILTVFGAASVSAQPGGRRGGVVLAGPSTGGVVLNRNAVYGTVTGTISWPKALGVAPMYPGASTEYAMPCGLIVILAKKTSGHSGSFGQWEVVGRGSGSPAETDELRRGRFYTCSYTINGLPKDTGLLITAEFIDTRTFDTEPWLTAFTQSGRAAPPAGKVRVFTGGGGVTLTNGQPSAVINFGIGYAPAANMPR